VVITRRILLRIAGGAFAVEWRRSARSAVLEGQSWRHGLSLFGNLKYRSGFAYFDYVNPHAPKGGVVRQAVLGTYNNFNVVVAGWKGQLAAGIGLIYDTLLTPSLDEASAEYGLLAEAVLHPADFSSVTFRLHPEAKWHDGRSVTPDDVVFSFNAFKENNPRLSTYHRRIVMVAPTGEREITFTFDSGGNRELPQIVGQLTILPKHWWETADQSGNRRSVAATSLEPPIGSGPYRIAEFKPGQETMSGTWRWPRLKSRPATGSRPRTTTSTPNIISGQCPRNTHRSRSSDESCGRPRCCRRRTVA
jgi:microcin C transport system substrate-binding protein